MLKDKLDLAYDLHSKADKNAMLLEKLFESEVIDEEENLKNSKPYGQDEE